MSKASSLYQNYARAPLSFEKGEGVWLETSDGEKYLDFAAGIAVNSLGHAHPHLVKTLQSQAERLWHVSNLYEIPDQERLARRLCEASFADMVFFCNSGAEAIEASIKTARRHFFEQGEPDRYQIITFEGAFHGRTLATITAGGQEKHLEGFGPKVQGFDQVPLGDLDSLKKIVGPQTAAVLIEPIQGESGINSVPNQFLRELRELCTENGILMILDEIQCGIGRTGKLFAYEWLGIEPDLMAIAKGIGGGFPIGACLAKKEVGISLVKGSHGTTFGGNPLAMAVGNAVLDIVLEPGFLSHVEQVGLRLKQRLAELVDTYPTVFELVRGEGLMLGLKCRMPPAEVIAELRDAHLLAVPAGDNVVRILPPLIVTNEEVGIAMGALEMAASKLKNKNSEGAT